MTIAADLREHRVVANGIDLHYLEWGHPDAPPLVLLHGLTGHAHIWEWMAPALAERYHVYAPDQRGHGDSAHAATYATVDYVADLAALAAHWRLDRFPLAGLSMGGHNALAFAAQHPGRITQLCAIDIPPKLQWHLSPNHTEGLRLIAEGHRAYGSFEEAYADARADNMTAPDENLRHRTRHNLHERADGTFSLKWDPKAQAHWDPVDLWPLLPSITSPTLLVRADINAYLPQDVAERMAAAIGGDTTIVDVPTSGHSVPTDKPELLAPILIEWLVASAPG